MLEAADGRPPTAAVPKLVGAWYEASLARHEWSLHHWLEPAVIRVASLFDVGHLVRRDAPHEMRHEAADALRRFGAARASGGFSASATLLDLDALVEVAGVPRDQRDGLERAVTDGWCSDSAAVDDAFASRAGLGVRVRSLYHGRGPGTPGRGARADHALVVVDVPIEPDDPARFASAVAAASTAATGRFPSGRLALVAAGRMAILVRRHPGLVPMIERFRDDVAAIVDDLSDASRVWLERLPPSVELVAPFLEMVADAPPPEFDTGDLDASLVTAAAGDEAPAGRRSVLTGLVGRHRPLPVALTAAAAVMSLIIGLATVVDESDGPPVEVATASPGAGGPFLLVRPAVGTESGSAIPDAPSEQPASVVLAPPPPSSAPASVTAVPAPSTPSTLPGASRAAPTGSNGRQAASADTTPEAGAWSDPAAGRRSLRGEGASAGSRDKRAAQGGGGPSVTAALSGEDSTGPGKGHGKAKGRANTDGR